MPLTVMDSAVKIKVELQTSREVPVADIKETCRDIGCANRLENLTAFSDCSGLRIGDGLRRSRPFSCKEKNFTDGA